MEGILKKNEKSESKDKRVSFLESQKNNGNNNSNSIEILNNTNSKFPLVDKSSEINKSQAIGSANNEASKSNEDKSNNSDKDSSKNTSSNNANNLAEIPEKKSQVQSKKRISEAMNMMPFKSLALKKNNSGSNI